MVRARALVIASLVTLGRAAPAQAQVPEAPAPDAVELARRLFREGVEAAEAGRWDEARLRFTRVLSIRSAPLVRFNLALACRNAGHLIEAVEHYRQFALDPSSAADRPRMAAAAQEIEAISQRIARLQVVVSGDDPQGFMLDGRPQSIALLGQEIPVDPGNHVVVVEGRAGDRQSREGTLFEGTRTQVAIALTPTAPDPVTAPVRTTAPSREQSFGHWVARPGPGGRWVDWAAQGTPAPPSVWERRPFTLALGVGGGSPVGIFSLSMRYFPQRWFGLEVAGGGPSGYGAGFLLHAHVRVPLAAPSIYAIGAFVGPGLNLTAFQLACTSNCSTPAETRVEHVTALSLDLGTSHEWRLGDHFTLRFTAGLRWLVNRADLRASALGQPVSCTSVRSSPFGDSPCGHVTGDSSGLGGFLGLDIGYGIGP
jgi:hypothetical protein